MAKSSEQCDVAVIGAGVAGLCAALALARRGVRSHVIDRIPIHLGRERGDVLHTAGRAVLDQLGANANVAQQGYRIVNEFEILDTTGHRLLGFDLRHLTPSGHLFTIPYSALRVALLDACHASGAVSFGWGVVATGLSLQNSRISGVETTHGSLLARLTVIASGTHCPIRVSYFASRRQFDYRSIFISAHSQSAVSWLDKALYVLGPGGVLIAVPLPENRVRIGMQVKDGRQSIIGGTTFLEEAITRLPMLRSYGLVVSQLQRYALHGHLAHTFWRPGAVVCGDAAHTVHPVGGQGMNLALLSAASLGQIVGFNLADAQQTDDECRIWARKNQRRAARVYARTHVLGRLATIDHATFSSLRNSCLSYVDKFAFLKAFALRKFSTLT